MLGMSRAIPIPSRYVFLAWTGTAFFTSYLTVNTLCLSRKYCSLDTV